LNVEWRSRYCLAPSPCLIWGKGCGGHGKRDPIRATR
jgi:hypothetical protein